MVFRSTLKKRELMGGIIQKVEQPAIKEPDVSSTIIQAKPKTDKDIIEDIKKIKILDTQSNDIKAKSKRLEKFVNFKI